MNNCTKVFLCNYSSLEKNECEYAKFQDEVWKRCIFAKAILDGMTLCLNKKAQENIENEDI